jgi:hypothetical protein
MENINDTYNSFCSKCGNSVKQGDKFCAKCGNNLDPEVEEHKIKSVGEIGNLIICSTCGSSVPSDKSYCIECGARLVNNSFVTAKHFDNARVSTPKLYSGFVVNLGTILGGPLAAGIFMSRNYKALGKENASTIALIIGIISTILLDFILVIGFEIIPSFLILLIPILFANLLFEIFQKSNIQALLNKGWKKESGLKIFGIILFSMAITLVIIYLPNTTAFNSFVKNDGIYEYNKGLGYQETNQRTLAEQQYKLAIQKNPNLAEAYLNLGLIYLDDEWLEGAEEMTSKSILIFKNTNKTIVSGSNSKQSLSIAYNNLGAIEIGKALKYETTNDYLSAKNHWEIGMNYFNEAIILDPMNSKAQANINKF